MSVPPVAAFFTNKTTIQLKTGQKFQGLLSRVDYKTSTVTLQDVEDLGNEQDHHCVPHDKKIPQKQFQLQNISQIFSKDKHFSEPKKYKKEEFWDAISEPTKEKKPYQKQDNRDNRKDYGRKKYEQKPRREDRERQPRKYEQRREPQPEQNQREFR